MKKIKFCLDEKWKRIENSKYFVSNWGRIKNRDTRKILNPWKDTRGYLTVSFFFDKKRKDILVHKLVALYFIGKRPVGFEIDHIDGSKENNYVENLEYVNSSENQKRAFSLGLKDHKGEKHPCSKLTKDNILELRKLCIGTGYYDKERIASQYGIHVTHLYKILNHKVWSHV